MSKKQKIEVLISESELKKRTQEIAKKISQEAKGEEIVLICVLKGALFFFVDLVREIEGTLCVDFVKASSYEGTESTGKIQYQLTPQCELAGKFVYLVEDIVDTGLTMKVLMEDLKKRSPKALKLVSLLHKPARTLHPIPIDHLGFEIPDKFVIGYGLDYEEKFRELPYVGVYSES